MALYKSTEGGTKSVDSAYYGTFAGPAYGTAINITLGRRPTYVYVYDTNGNIDWVSFSNGNQVVGVKSDNVDISNSIDITFSDTGFSYTERLTGLSRTVKYFVVY